MWTSSLRNSAISRWGSWTSKLQGLYQAKLVPTFLSPCYPKHIINSIRHWWVWRRASCIPKKWSWGVWLWDKKTPVYEVCTATIQEIPEWSWYSHWRILHIVPPGIWTKQSTTMVKEGCTSQPHNHCKYFLLHLCSWCYRATHKSRHASRLFLETCDTRALSSSRARYRRLTYFESNLHKVCLHVQKPSIGWACASFCQPIHRISQVSNACQPVICCSLHWEDVDKKVPCIGQIRSNCS